MGIVREEFGKTKNNEAVTKFTLENKNGVKVSILDLGAVITNILVPDRDGVFEDICLGYDNVPAYEQNRPAFGAVLGRVANRIAGAVFELNGKKYTLDQNDATNCLHGGLFKYEHCMYETECSEEEDAQSVSFTRLSRDMEQGFPGNVTITVTYTLNDANELMLEYYAVSDEDTVINLTNHCYFNIGKGGHRCKDVYGQDLQIFADYYTPVNDILVPTGEIRPVAGTALDFREPHKIGSRMGEAAKDDSTVEGYDNNFGLNAKEEGEVVKAVVYSDETTGRVMEVFTDFPAMQVYASVVLDDAGGKEGMHYGKGSGICFETQNYPNAVNTPEFPSAVLKAGEEYSRVAIFRFDVME